MALRVTTAHPGAETSTPSSERFARPSASTRSGSRAAVCLLVASIALGHASCRCSGGTGRKVDVHARFPAEADPRVVELMNRHGIGAVINLSGGVPGRGLEEQ